MGKKNDLLRGEEEIKQNPDNKIDQDFNGYPHGPAKEKAINPQTGNEKETADMDNKDGEKINYKKNEIDEQNSDGSANAFEDK